MSRYRYQPGPVHLLRVPTGEDLLGHLDAYVEENRIHAAWLSYLGAVRSASLRYYDQETKEYRDFTIDRHLEVLAGAGNVSLLDGEPFIHTHAAFADEEGRAFGGHVNYGCEVWALEVKIETFLGEAPVREFDETTALNLWGGSL